MTLLQCGIVTGKVYVLYAYNTESYPYVMSVFSSYSAMLVWLDQIHNYKAEVNSAGYFKEQLIIDEMKFSIYYRAFDVIGEHSHKTNTISFDQ